VQTRNEGYLNIDAYRDGLTCVFLGSFHHAAGADNFAPFHILLPSWHGHDVMSTCNA
jgi:hypothetical protein